MMRVTVDTSKLIAQLKVLREQIERKLNFMVKEWAYRVGETIIDKTPIGDSELFGSYYLSRKPPLPQEEGLSKGNWQVSFDGNFETNYQNYGQQAGEYAAEMIYSKMDYYQVGQTFYIGEKTPYIEKLNKGHSKQLPEGFEELISKTTKLYALNLKQYYDSAGE